MQALLSKWWLGAANDEMMIYAIEEFGYILILIDISELSVMGIKKIINIQLLI